MSRIVNLTEAASFLGVSLPTMRKWVKISGSEWVLEHGGEFKPWKINATAAHTWVCQRAVETAINKINEYKELKRAKLRLLTAKADKAEFDLACLRGEMMEIDEAERIWTEHVMTVRNRLLAMPSKLGPIVAYEEDPASCMELIRVELYDALDELSRRGDEEDDEY